MFWITDKFAGNESQNNQTSQNLVTYNSLVSAGDEIDSGDVGRRIKNLSTVAKSAKSKKLNLAKSKKSDLEEFKNSTLPNDFVNAISTRTDFLTVQAKKTFIHLRKSVTKAPILRHYNL